MKSKDFQLLVTGSKFTGRGFRAIEMVLMEIVQSAREEIYVAAYILTPLATGLLDILEKALEKGVRVTAIIDDLEKQPSEIKKKLHDMSDKFTHMRLVNFYDPEGGHLHAKAIVVDRRVAVIGSANLTWGGLVANHELAFVVYGDEAWHIASLLDAIASE